MINDNISFTSFSTIDKEPHSLFQKCGIGAGSSYMLQMGLKMLDEAGLWSFEGLHECYRQKQLQTK